MSTNKLDITEIFFSIQGEGTEIGLPTIFIRLAGCNLRCKYCDTKYAYKNGKKLIINEIIDILNRWSCKRVCITGGEPLLQEAIYKLIDELIKRDYHLSIETNGTQSIDELLNRDIMIKHDIKLPFSGYFNHMLLDNIKLLRETDELKFIINDMNDYTCAKKILVKYRPTCHVIMQPVGNSEFKLADKIIEDGLEVRFSPQLHKILWGNIKGK